MAGTPSTADRSKPSSSASARHSRWDWKPPSSTAAAQTTTAAAANHKAQSNPKPSPKPALTPTPDPRHNHLHPPSPAPPQPTYGFHMLERRTVVLADGSVRTYYALPPDYQDFPQPMPMPMPLPRMLPPPTLAPIPGPRPGPFWHDDRLSAMGIESGKRKLRHENDRFEEEEPSSKFMRPCGAGEDRGSWRGRGGGGRSPAAVATKHSEVDQAELKKAFLRFVKTVNDHNGQRKGYLENNRLSCPACPAIDGRSSKDFPETHSLVMHCYNTDNDNLLVDHLGLHKALCVLMGWNYSIIPDNSKRYQYLPPDEAAENQEDLIMWPPMVIIHNTITGKNPEGRMEGLGNKYMDARIKDLGFSGGKSKSLYGREGHLGITLVKFSSDQAGLKEAMRMADHFERENHGRMAWSSLQPLTLGGPDDENNPRLMNLGERSRDKRRILFAYLGTSNDVDKIDYETRKKIAFESLREIEFSPSK